MPSYLLTWNPNKWKWVDLEQEERTLKEEGTTVGSWSCGNSKRIRAGDRVFLLRQAVEPRGLVASGWALTDSYLDDHWGDQSGLGRKTRYVMVEWDALNENPIIARAELDEERFAAANWNSQSSGISIPASVARNLEIEWGRRVGSYFEFGPDEAVDADFAAGDGQPTVVNSHERLAHGRAACLAHYGFICSVCGFNFVQVYGEAAAGLIHVHHTVQSDEIDKNYRLNPIEELRPVCANCHAMIHRREPAYTIEEVADLIMARRSV